jgi:hypothetical protein
MSCTETILNGVTRKKALTVDSLDGPAPRLRENGAVIRHEPPDAPGGRNLTARNPDGLIVEYYEAARDR